MLSLPRLLILKMFHHHRYKTNSSYCSCLVVSAKSPVGHPTYFSQFYNPNVVSWSTTTAPPTAALSIPLTSQSIPESSHVSEAVALFAPPKSVTFSHNSGGAIYYFTQPHEQVFLKSTNTSDISCSSGNQPCF